MADAPTRTGQQPDLRAGRPVPGRQVHSELILGGQKSGKFSKFLSRPVIWPKFLKIGGFKNGVHRTALVLLKRIRQRRLLRNGVICTGCPLLAH